MKMITLHQPWASLIACGAKTIETRSWSTPYRGPLAIHAGQRRPTPDDMRVVAENIDAWNAWGAAGFVYEGGEMDPGPLGAVVAVCDLVDVVPMVGDYEATCGAYEGPAALEITPNRSLVLYPAWAGALDESDELDVSDQLPYGDFGPGRFAWLLRGVRALPHPVRVRGVQGVKNLPAPQLLKVLAQLEVRRDSSPA